MTEQTVIPNPGVVIANSALGAEVDLEASVGVDAAVQITVESTLGVGPQGPQGETGPVGPQGVQGVQGVQGPAGENGTEIVVVPAVDWPPAAPVSGVLYLRGI